MLTKKSFAILLTIVALAIPIVGITQAQRGGRPPFGNNRPNANAMQQLMTLATEATGLTVPELAQELRGGKTLADIVTEKGGDIAVLTQQAEAVITESVNAAVAEGKLTQAQADMVLSHLPQVLQDLSTGTRPLGGIFPNFGGRGGMFGGRGGMFPNFGERGANPTPSLANVMQLVQDKAGLTAVQVREQLQGGKTLGQLLTDANVNIDEFVSEVIAPVQARFAEQVANGTMSQALADARLALFRVELTERLNSDKPLLPRRPRR